MKKLISTITIFIILSAAVAPFLASAQGFAQFNFLPGSPKLLNVANRTQNTGWQNYSVTATANDSVGFKVYYHNGAEGTVAHNTRVRLTFPTVAQNNITVGATLGADNATTIADSVIINSAVAQTLNFNSGLIYWYPNQAVSPTIISATAIGPGFLEVNLGDIQACWPYQGYVTFIANLVPSPAPTFTPAPTPTPTPAPIYNLSVAKLVRNQTANQSNFVESTNANVNDRLVWQIQVTNTGNGTLSNVFVRDILPSQLTYINGSTRNYGNALNDGIVSAGLNLGSLVSNASALITFETTVNSLSYSQTVFNYGYARADQVYEIYDTASAYLLAPAASPTPTPTGIANLSLNKTVRNYTSYSSFAESVNALGNERVTFQILIQNTGNFNANNVWVSDILPSGLGYVPGSARLDGGYLSDSLISGGVNIGSLNPGATRTILLDATVGYVGTGWSNQTLTNYAYVRADQINERNDSAVVYVSQQSPYVPPTYPTYYPSNTYYYSNLNLTKSVRNITSGQTGLTSATNAQIGDRLLFTIQLNTPTGANQYNQVNNVRIWDVMPSGLTYVVNTARLDSGWISDSLVSNGVYIGSIFSSQTKTITFEATVNSYGGNQTMTNYAYVSGDGIAQQSAFAQINTAGVVAPATTYAPVTYTPEPVVKGAAVAAVTGSNDLARNLVISLMVALWGIFFLYLYNEYKPNFNWQDLKFKYAVWKVKLKEKVM